jgi:sugar O-acyltransferase (sialic acid O-acetyltransferase NeuD family)
MRLYIYGAGEFAEIAYSYFSEEGKYEFQGFVVDDSHYDKLNMDLLGFPIYSYSESVEKLNETDVRIFVAISASRMNMDRAAIYNKLKSLGCQFATFISSKAFVSPQARIGENVFIFEENVIQKGAEIGDNTILWSGNHIGHQSKIGSHVFFSSHVVVSGYCNIESYCYFGVNSTLVDHISVAQGTLVGAGSLILRNTEINSVYVGSPAKKIDGKDPFKVIFR